MGRELSREKALFFKDYKAFKSGDISKWGKNGAKLYDFYILYLRIIPFLKLVCNVKIDSFCYLAI